MITDNLNNETKYLVNRYQSINKEIDIKFYVFKAQVYSLIH